MHDQTNGYTYGMKWFSTTLIWLDGNIWNILKESVFLEEWQSTNNYVKSNNREDLWEKAFQGKRKKNRIHYEHIKKKKVIW